KWRDPKENITYGINQVLAPNYNQLAQSTNLQGVELLRATLASYNAGLGNVQAAIREGRDPDYYTTGRDYGRDVLNRAGWFQLNGWA
ncbi:MAG TPA: transglycosylase SLT domain-containing protein, partial [Allocoleopsis sp.]